MAFINLKDFLNLVLTQGILLGPIIWAVIEYFDLSQYVSERWRRPLIAVVSGVIAAAAWALSTYLGYTPAPLDAPAFAEQFWKTIVLTGMTAFGSSTIVHGFLSGRTSTKNDS